MTYEDLLEGEGKNGECWIGLDFKIPPFLHIFTRKILSGESKPKIGIYKGILLRIYILFYFTPDISSGLSLMNIMQGLRW